jgi:CarboxypepD_reg-like domain
MHYRFGEFCSQAKPPQNHIQSRWQQYENRKLLRFKTAFFISFFFCIFSAFGQRTLNGRIVDQFMETAIGITIFDKDTIEIGQSDLNGYFKIKLPKENNKLIFAGVGYEWATITIPKECKNPEIILFLASTYDFTSPKKVDRLRKKEFEKIPELHSQAFQRGIFETEKPCVSRKFEPDFPDLEKIRRQDKLRKKEIKRKFKELNIGDVVKIPFGIDTSENEVRTYYSPCENCTEKDYDFVIEGEIIKKYKRKLTLEIMITKMKDYDFLKYRGKIIKINDRLKYEMKHYEVIIE